MDLLRTRRIDYKGAVVCGASRRRFTWGRLSVKACMNYDLHAALYRGLDTARSLSMVISL